MTSTSSKSSVRRTGRAFEPHPLDLERLAPASVGASDHLLIDEAAVGIEISKIGAAAQQQSLLKGHRSLRCACDPSIEPFSCATPGLLRVGVMP